MALKVVLTALSEAPVRTMDIGNVVMSGRGRDWNTTTGSIDSVRWVAAEAGSRLGRMDEQGSSRKTAGVVIGRAAGTHMTTGVTMDPPLGNSKFSMLGGCSKGRALGTTGRLGWVMGDSCRAWRNSLSNSRPTMMRTTVGIRANPLWQTKDLVVKQRAIRHGWWM